MRILIIVPSMRLQTKKIYKEYPLGAGYIGTALYQEGHTIKIIDQDAEGMSNEEVLEEVEKFAPEVILFSMVTSTYGRGLDILKAIKKSRPDLLCAAGGVHPTLFPERTVRDGFDYALFGEGEKSAPAFISLLPERKALQRVAGICGKTHNGEIWKTCRDAPTPLNMPVKRDLYNLSLYSHHTVIFSRGCPFGCKFCCDIFRQAGRDFIRTCSFDCMEKELESVATLKGDIFFADDIFMGSPGNMEKFCKLYKENKYSFKWVAQMRVDGVTEDVIERLAESGCKRIYLGCESGSDEILRTAGKRCTSKTIKNAIDMIHAFGIRVKTGWIYGLPGSLKEQYKAVDLMLAARPEEISIHKLIPFPGTHFFDYRDSYGIKIKDPYDFDIYSYSWLDDSITYAYLHEKELLKLLQYTSSVLNKEGYKSSDIAQPGDRFVYSMPNCKKPISVFKNAD